MRKTRIFALVGAAILLLSSCGTNKKPKPETDLDLTQYDSMTLDIQSIEDTSFTGMHPWPYPCTYTVFYALGEDFCVGDRVEVYYTELTEDENANESSHWTAEVKAVFVDFSDFELQPDVAYKPVIYLYPEEETVVDVSLDYKGTLTHTWPLYENGWSVLAYPNGRLTDLSGKIEYPYLFWEGEGNVEYDMSRGFCVAGGETEDFLREKLAYLGLSEAESAEFLEFWLPYMTTNEFNLIAFQTDAYTDGAKLTISPEPDSILRVFMAFSPLDAAVEIEAQQLEPFQREGFAVIEWGGAVVAP